METRKGVVVCVCGRLKGSKNTPKDATKSAQQEPETVNVTSSITKKHNGAQRKLT